MGKKRKIISKPQKFGRKHANHPLVKAASKPEEIKETVEKPKPEIKKPEPISVEPKVKPVKAEPKSVSKKATKPKKSPSSRTSKTKLSND
mgnify:CR=1 FL=1